MQREKWKKKLGGKEQNNKKTKTNPELDKMDPFTKDHQNAPA